MLRRIWLLLGVASVGIALAAETGTKATPPAPSPNIPDAKVGDCYARLAHPPVYQSWTEQVLKTPAYEQVKVVPAQYEWVEEKVMVRDAMTVTEVIPARYEWVEEKVVVKDASQKIQVLPSKNVVTEQDVLIKEGGEKLVAVPPEYKTVAERVEVEPAKTVWKEVCIPGMPCSGKHVVRRLVEEPARYETVIRSELVKPASVRRHEAPAEFAKIKTLRQTEAPRITTASVPAEYTTVKVQRLVEPARTVSREIPPEYTTVRVQKLVKPAGEERITVPAQYEQVSKRTLVAEARDEWGRVPCEDRFNGKLLAKVQSALAARKYDIGKADGLYGPRTRKALEQFQRDNNLAQGMLSYQTLEALKIEP